MLMRADQLRVGDQLHRGEVVWVVPTPDGRYLTVGLRTRPRTPGGTPGHASHTYRIHDSVVVLRHDQP